MAPATPLTYELVVESLKRAGFYGGHVNPSGIVYGGNSKQRRKARRARC
jgi:hypothetical protein